MNTIAKAAEESTDMFCFPYQVFSLRLPFNFRSDLHDTSPCDFNTLFCKTVMRENKLISLRCYLDITPNSPVLFTRKYMEVRREKYLLDLGKK